MYGPQGAHGTYETQDRANPADGSVGMPGRDGANDPQQEGSRFSRRRRAARNGADRVEGGSDRTETSPDRPENDFDRLERGGGDRIQGGGPERIGRRSRMEGMDRMDRAEHVDRVNRDGMDQTGQTDRPDAVDRESRAARRRRTDRLDQVVNRLHTAGSRNGGRVGVTYKYFGAPDGATAARVPISMRPEELGGDELGMNGMFTKIKPETMAAMVLTGIEGVPLHKVPPLELVVLHPDYAVVKLPMTVVDPLRGIGEEAVGAAAFIWSTVPDRGGPRDAFNVYQLLHEWQDFSHRLHEAGHQPYCLVWP